METSELLHTLSSMANKLIISYMANVIQTAEDVLPGLLRFHSSLRLVLLCCLFKKNKKIKNKKHTG